MTTPLAQLARLEPALRVTALCETIAAAPEGEIEPLAAALIEHAAAQQPSPIARALRPLRRAGGEPDDALAAIALCWARFTPQLRLIAAQVGRGRWARALAPRHTGADARHAALAVFESTADPDLAAIVAGFIGSDDRRLSRGAERALVMAAELAVDAPSVATGRRHDALPRDYTELDVARWIRAIADAIWSRHRAGGPMLAGILVLSRPDWPEPAATDVERIRRLALEPSAESSAGLRSALRRAPFARARAVAWRYLAAPGLAPAAAERLLKAETPEEHEAALAARPLARRPRRARALAELAHTSTASAALLPAPNALAALSAEARIGAIEWTRLLATPLSARDAALEPLLAASEPRVRLLLAARGERAALRDCCFDNEPVVARTAVHRWSSLGRHTGDPGPARARTLTHLVRSPVPAVRRAARADAARADPFVHPGPAAAVALRRMHRADPQAARERVHHALAHPDPSRRLAALALLARTALETDFAEAILDCATHADPRVAATAVRRLARLPGPAVEDRLRSALATGEPRTRANAVEALAERATGPQAPAYAVCLELKGDPHHRVRANAIRELIRTAASETPAGPAYDSAGIDALIEMLADPRPAHRIAGAWLAQRAAPVLTPRRFGPARDAVADLLATIADADADPRARTRGALARDRVTPGPIAPRRATAGGRA